MELLNLGLNSISNLFGLIHRTGVVSLTNVHGNRDLIDGGERDELGDGVTILVGWGVLLETLLDRTLSVMEC